MGADIVVFINNKLVSKWGRRLHVSGIGWLHENGAANIEIVSLLLSLVTGIYCFSSDSFSCVYVQKIAKQSAPRASIWTISKNPTAAKDGLWQYKQWR